MNKIRILGDVHGNIKQYLQDISSCEYSVQIGDLAFNYDFIDNIDSSKHKIFCGNHCNVPEAFTKPHNLGGFGPYTLNKIPFFFIRGAASIDKKWRIHREFHTGVKIWWEEEELRWWQCAQCVRLFKEAKPDLVLSHDCPESVSKIIGDPNILKTFGFDPETYSNRTQQLLQSCFEVHRPKHWIFGHYHKSHDILYGGTRFICINQNKYLDVDSNLEVYY